MLRVYRTPWEGFIFSYLFSFNLQISLLFPRINVSQSYDNLRIYLTKLKAWQTISKITCNSTNLS